MRAIIVRLVAGLTFGANCGSTLTWNVGSLDGQIHISGDEDLAMPAKLIG